MPKYWMWVGTLRKLDTKRKTIRKGGIYFGWSRGESIIIWSRSRRAGIEQQSAGLV